MKKPINFDKLRERAMWDILRALDNAGEGKGARIKPLAHFWNKAARYQRLAIELEQSKSNTK